MQVNVSFCRDLNEGQVYGTCVYDQEKRELRISNLIVKRKETTADADLVPKEPLYVEGDLAQLAKERLCHYKEIGRRFNDKDNLFSASLIPSDEITLIKTEEIEAIERWISRHEEEPATIDLSELAGKQVRLTIKEMNSVLTPSSKRWNLVFESDEIDALRKSLKMTKETFKLPFAKRDEPLNLVNLIRKCKNDIELFNRISCLSPENFTSETLHEAVNKDLSNVTALHLRHDIPVFKRTVKIALVPQDLLEAYDRNQAVLKSEFSRAPFDCDPDALFGKTSMSEDEVLDLIKKIPVDRLTSNHLHKAIEINMLRVVNYLRLQCVPPYLQSCDVLTESHPSIAKELKADWDRFQRFLTDRYRQRPRVDLFEQFKTLKDEADAQQWLTTIPISRLDGRFYSLAVNCNWNQIVHYLTMQGINPESTAITTPARTDAINVPGSTYPFQATRKPESSHGTGKAHSVSLPNLQGSNSYSSSSSFTTPSFLEQTMRGKRTRTSSFRDDRDENLVTDSS